MKLSVSNVSWYDGSISEFVQVLTESGCQGMELALSKIWSEPTQSTLKERRHLKNQIADSGLKLCALQALLFKRPDLLLFGEEKKRVQLAEYLINMMDVCYYLEGEVMVFGSPANRKISKESIDTSHTIAVQFFSKLAEEAEERGIYFSIEPLGISETNYINSVSDAYNLMEELGFPEGLGLHIDTKGVVEVDELHRPYMKKMFSIAKHVHISEPGLRPVGSGDFDHTGISRIIRNSGYSKYISIEMRRTESNVEESVKKSIQFVQDLYFEDNS